MADFGVDFAGYLDIDQALSTVSGWMALAHAVARRLTQPTGGLIDRPDYGFDVRRLLNAPINRSFVERRITDECLREERVRSAQVGVAFTASTGQVDIDIQISSADGPFAMTLAISQVTTEIFFKQAA